MNITHLGNMGVGTVLTGALREIGHKSQVVVDTPHPFGFDEDIVMFPGKIPSHFKTIKIRRKMWSIKNSDVFHMHGLQSPIYLKLINNSKSKKVFHYHSPFDEPSPRKGLFDMIFVSIPKRLHHISESIWIPLPVDTRKMQINNQEIVRNTVTIGVGSSFSDSSKAKLLKRDLIDKAVSELQTAGHKISILEFKGYQHYEVLKYWKNIDIWIDRFDSGFYGWNALEAASCSIPVLCQIDEESKSYIPNCPFLPIEPVGESLKSKIEYLLNESDRMEIGQMCRNFVIRNHDSRVVAKKCIEEYSKIE